MKRAAIYARYSSDNQREESISAQIYECEQYAKKNELIIVNVYTDEAKSGTSDDRPGFQKMIDDAEKNLFDVLLVHKLDRFARDRYDSVIYKRALRNQDISLISVTQPLDDSPESIILESLLEGMDEYYSRNLARESMKGLKENARNCLFNGGRPPLGYDIDPETKKYIINESEAFLVQKIFELYDQGLGYDKIITYLNGTGCKTKFNRPFSKTSLSSILKNEKYIGVYVFNRTAGRKNGKRNNNKSKPESEIIRIPDGVPRIIDQDLWDRVQAKLKARKHPANRARLKAKVNYLLSGKIFCGKCGSPMVGNTCRNGKVYSYYECNLNDRQRQCNAKRIRKEQIELIVLSKIEEEIFSNIPLLLENLNKMAAEKNNSFGKELNFLQKEISSTQKKLTNILQAIEDGAYSKLLFEQLTKHEERLSELNNQIDTLNTRKKSVIISEEMLTELICVAKEKLYSNNDDQATKALIQQFVDKVIITENQAEIHLNLILDASGVGDGT